MIYKISYTKQTEPMSSDRPAPMKRQAVAPDMHEAADERYLVPALIRGLKILGTLAEDANRLTLSEVATSLGVTRSSAYRLLYTLGHLGFVDYDAKAKSYALGPQVLALGYRYLASRDLIDVATPHLVRLRDRTGWSAHLGELHGRDVVYLARVATRRSIASTVHVGTRLPAHATTMGRILLGALSERELRELYHDDLSRPHNLVPYAGIDDLVQRIALDRASGVVVQNSGYEPGVASIAAPVRDVSDRIVAAINISAVALLVGEAELNGPLKTEVVATAAAISKDLGRPAERASGGAAEQDRRSAG